MKELILAALLAALAQGAWAQGQDSTPTERDIMVLAEMLPGVYDSQEQFYFEGRGGVRPEARNARMNSKIVRVDLPAFGKYVFFVQDSLDNKLDQPNRVRLYTLEADNKEQAVRMRMYYLDQAEGEAKKKYWNADQSPDVLKDLKPDTTPYTQGCDVLWKREAGQFHGAMKRGDCTWTRKGDNAKRVTDYHMQLTTNALWVRELTFDAKGKQIAGNPDGVYHKMNRARQFMCQADIPGVSGGRDIPFKRHGPFPMTDQGGAVKFMSEEPEPREVNITLRNVDWQINNETGAFTRDVLVMYVFAKDKDGKIAQSAYSFTEPTVKRTGLNLGWTLVMCFMESNREGKPEF
ncbi:MAG: chromophore lyase CpcT/CpeT [Rhodospirillaceae bacterium]|nr:chromophore lyase CpcT/CpeT [Rhodospirillaceae bacterium]